MILYAQGSQGNFRNEKILDRPGIEPRHLTWVCFVAIVEEHVVLNSTSYYLRTLPSPYINYQKFPLRKPAISLGSIKIIAKSFSDRVPTILQFLGFTGYHSLSSIFHCLNENTNLDVCTGVCHPFAPPIDRSVAEIGHAIGPGGHFAPNGPPVTAIISS